MIALRVLGMFIVIGLMTGCVHLGEDVHNLKAYLRAFPPPGSCEAPGVKQARLCYYELEVMATDKPNGLYKGHVAKKTVEQGVKDCLATKARIDEKFRYVDYECPDAKNYNFAWFGFKIEGSTPNDGYVELVNIPNTHSLREGKAAEVKLDLYGLNPQPHAP